MRKIIEKIISFFKRCKKDTSAHESAINRADLQKITEKIDRLFKEHKRDTPEYESALKELISLAQNNGEYAGELIAAKFKLAKFYSAKFKFEPAQKLYLELINDKRSLKFGDNFFNYGLDALRALAYDFRIQKRFSEAVFWYERLLKLVPNDYLALDGIAVCAKKSGDFAREREIYSAMIGTYFRGDAPRCESDCEGFVRLKMKLAQSYFDERNFTQCRRELDGLMSALEGIGEAVEDFSSQNYAFINAHHLMAKSYFEESEFKLAREHFLLMKTLAQTDKFFLKDARVANEFLTKIDEILKSQE